MTTELEMTNRLDMATRVSRALAASLGFVVVITMAIEVSAQDGMSTISTEGTAKAESSAEASRAIVQNTTATVARQQILEIVGEKNYQKNKTLIENRIVREAYKFIPFVTPSGTPVKAGDVWKMEVQLRVATESLRQMIIDNGLLYDTEGPAAILPMVSMIDRVRGSEYRWWSGAKEEPAQKFVRQASQDLNQALFRELNRQGFYVIRPTSSGLMTVVPESYRADRHRPEDLRFLGDFFNAQMIVRGDVRFRQSTEISGGYQIAIKLSAVQAANARSVGEVTRIFETEPGVFENVARAKLQTAFADVAKDLGVQVVDAWAKGTLGSNLLRLSLRGRLNPKQVTTFKTQMMKNVREVKSMRERIIEPSGITFEIDYAGQAAQFSERFKSLALPGFAMKLASGGGDNGVVLDIKAQ